MYVSKEEAKRMIDEAPGKIWVDSFNNISFIHTRPKVITRAEGVEMVRKATDINYQNNDVFSLLCLSGVQELMTHNIRFPNMEIDI